jgi:transcriptional regulator with XRE-family HTH domain
VQKSIYSAENIRLCEMLKDARVEKELTQAQLADRLGKPQSFVAKVERGERRLDVVEFVKVVQSLGLIPSDFLRDYVDELTRQ